MNKYFKQDKTGQLYISVELISEILNTEIESKEPGMEGRIVDRIQTVLMAGYSESISKLQARVAMLEEKLND